MLIVNEHHLRPVLTEYLIHYNTARPHRALGQLPPAQAHTPPPQIDLAEHRIRRKQVLGGLTTSTRSPPDSRAPPREAAGHGHIRVFEPHRVASLAIGRVAPAPDAHSPAPRPCPLTRHAPPAPKLRKSR